MNYVITRAGYRIGFFSLADADTVNNKISLVNEETPFANDLTQTASEQVAALQAQGVDAIICIATPGMDTAALQTTLKDLGVTAIVDGSSSASGQDTLYRAGAALGLDGVARFDLVFTQGGGCRAEVQSANVKALGNSYKAQRKMTHEFRGYLFALSDMLANGDTAAAQTYLDELKVRQTERILLVNTHNPIIDDPQPKGLCGQGTGY